MGRVKLKLMFIEDERRRIVCFKKRIPSLKKKASDLSSLCGLDVLLICFGPQEKVYTYPEDDHAVRDIIVRYQRVSKKKQDKHYYDLLGYLNEEINKKSTRLQKELNQSLVAIDERIKFLMDRVHLEHENLSETQFDRSFDMFLMSSSLDNHGDAVSNEGFEGRKVTNWQDCSQDGTSCSPSMIDSLYHSKDQILQPISRSSNMIPMSFSMDGQRHAESNESFEGGNITNWQDRLQGGASCSSNTISPLYHAKDQVLQPISEVTQVLYNNVYDPMLSNLHGITNACMATDALFDHHSYPPVFVPENINPWVHGSSASDNNSTYSFNAKVAPNFIQATRDDGFLREFIDAFEGYPSTIAAAMPSSFSGAL